MNNKESTRFKSHLDMHRRRLQVLEQQLASFGTNYAPSHIVIEIEDLRKTIADLTAQSTDERSSETFESGVELHRTAIPAPHVFLSYSRKNSQAVELLADQLRIRGIRVWRDIDNLDLGRMTQREIQEALRHVDAAILYLTRESLKSEYILSVELPEVIARHRDEPDFPIISILDGVTFDQIDRATRATGQRLSEFNAIRLLVNADLTARDVELSHVARRVLDSVLPSHLWRLDQGQAIDVDLFSRLETEHNYPATVRLDWVRPFRSNPPPPETCRLLQGALNDLHEVLRKGGLRPIALRPAGAHLTVGYAFGYVFRATAGFTLWVEQHFPPHTGIGPQWWRANESPIPESPLVLTPTAVDTAKPDITIEISINKSVEEHVNNWIGAETPSLRTRLGLAPEGGLQPNMLLDGPQTLAIAQQVREAIARYRRPGGRTHIFGAIPVGLAVLIGAQLNACGLIQCYELVKDAYCPTFLLGE